MNKNSYSEIEKIIIKVTQLYDSVPYELAMELVTSYCGEELERSRRHRILESLDNLDDIFISSDGKTVYGTGRRDIIPDIKDIRALWVFTKFVRSAGEEFNLAKFPASLVFRSADELWRITVLQNSDFLELKALKNLRVFEGVKEIIVSPYDDIDEIDEELLPEGEFKFARISSDEDIYARPEIRIYTVK